jgi:hypothetical protein
MLIHRKSDRIPVDFIGDNDDKVTAYFTPLTMAEKNLIIAAVPQNTEDVSGVLSFSRMVIKATLKGISGIKCVDGSDYSLTMEDGKVTDDCLDEIMNLPDLFQKTMLVSNLFLQGVPREGKIVNPQTGKTIDDIIVKKAFV